MRKMLWALSGLAVLGALKVPAPLQAQESPIVPAVPRNNTFLGGVRLPARSQYAVTAQSGPWMICAAHYTGPHAAFLAEQVVRQLREGSLGQRINAFVFNHADEHRRKENEENMARYRQNPDGFRPRFTRVEEQCAVLIGGFKDMETARSALPAVKKLQPPKVQFPGGEDASEKLVVLEDPEEKDEPKKPALNNPFGGPRPKTKQVAVNPFVRSFVIRNPAAPSEKFDPATRVDPFWKKLNAHEPYSLLKCKKKYTILVKLYQGGSVIDTDERLGGKKKDEGFLAKIGFGRSGPDVMEGIARQAHELARFLRHYQLESYVLHTRQTSLVTVGSFDSLDSEEFRQMQQKLSTLKLVPTGGDPGMASVFELMPNPMPMPIPKL